MRVIVFGASGRVGTHLVEAVLADPGLDLAAAVVSPQSDRRGIPVAAGAVEYRAADPTMNAHADVIVDFSTPAASIELQRMLDRKPIPVVIGTTGFVPDQQHELEHAGRYRPILASANFAVGFEPFLGAATGLRSAASRCGSERRGNLSRPQEGRAVGHVASIERRSARRPRCRIPHRGWPPCCPATDRRAARGPDGGDQHGQFRHGGVGYHGDFHGPFACRLCTRRPGRRAMAGRIGS